MDSNQFEIVQILELPSSIIRDVELKKDVIEKCQLQYLVVLQYQKDSDIVGLHVLLRFVTNDEKVMLNEGATFVSRIDRWNELDHASEALRTDRTITSLVNYAIPFVCGMIFRHTSGTILSND